MLSAISQGYNPLRDILWNHALDNNGVPYEIDGWGVSQYVVNTTNRSDATIPARISASSFTIEEFTPSLVFVKGYSGLNGVSIYTTRNDLICIVFRMSDMERFNIKDRNGNVIWDGADHVSERPAGGVVKHLYFNNLCRHYGERMAA